MPEKSQHGGKRKGAGRPRKKVGRPSKNVTRVSVTIPEALSKEIDRFCKTAEMGRSAFLEMAAQYFLTNATGRAEK